jgi:uncharacterized protein
MALSLSLPRPTLTVGGAEIPALQTGLLDCVIEHRRSVPSSCTATFVNWGQTGTGPGYLYFGRRPIDFGVAFAVSIATGSLFQGRIAAIEGEFPDGTVARLRVTSEDALALLAERNGVRTFADATDADVVRRIAADHGLAAQVTLNGPSRRAIAQGGESDLAFLRARLAAVGAYCWIDGKGRLCAAHEPGGAEAAMVFPYGGTLRALRVAADVRGQSMRVQARGWDVAAKAAASSLADRTSVAAEIAANGSAGSAVREAAFGPAERLLPCPSARSTAHTQSLASTAFADRTRGFLSGVAELSGVQDLRPGRSVDLRGLGPLFSGLYRVEAVTHRFDGMKGWRTELAVERPWLGAP